MCDGNTDSPLVEQKLVYVRYQSKVCLSPSSSQYRIYKLAMLLAYVCDRLDTAFECAGFSAPEWETASRLDGAVMLGQSQGVAAS